MSPAISQYGQLLAGDVVQIVFDVIKQKVQE